MKILKGILTGIGVLAALLCALIIMSATNPGITEGLSSLLSGDDSSVERNEEESPESRQEEDFFDELEKTIDTLEIPELTDTDFDVDSEEEEEPGETVARQPDIPVTDSSDDEP